MRAQNIRSNIVPDGVPRRPDRTQIATAEEGRTATSTFGQDDSCRPNPNPGSLQLDVSGQERSSTSLRKVTHFGTWNVQGLTTGKLTAVENEMETCGIKIIGIAEHWWHNEGRFKTENGNTVVFCGKRSGRKERGVGFIVEKDTAKSIMGYNPVSERVITLRIKADPINITLIQVYAPTSNSSEEEIDDFCESIQKTMDDAHKRDIKILMGDWNAKIGKSAQKTPNIGTFG
jgi:hypothetical protein